MKKIFATTGLISLIGSFLLHYLFNYTVITVLYHLSVIVIIHIVVFIINLITSRISKQPWGKILLNTFNFLFLFLLIIFYLAVLGSNAFWGKTITLKILSDYVLSIHDLIAVLPVEAWIFYIGFAVLLLIIIFLFIIVHPQYAILSSRYRNIFDIKTYPYRFAAICFVFILLLVLFRQPIMRSQRMMHFSEEPVLEFVFGNMWNPYAINDLYSVERQKNSLKERECIDSVRPSGTENKPHASIVVLVDALRNDHLPMYGYSRMTTPFLDSLSKAGQLLAVRRAFSTS